MIYAKDFNGTIKRVTKEQIKKAYPNIIGSMNLEILATMDVYPYEQPILPDKHVYGEIYFDEVNNVFTREVIVQVFDLEQIRSKQKQRINNATEAEYQKYDKYVIEVSRKRYMGINADLPAALQTEFLAINAWGKAQKALVNAATTVNEMLDVVVDYNNVNAPETDIV